MSDKRTPAFGAIVVLLCVAANSACSKPRSALDPNNQLPFGFVDKPRDNETVGRMVEVAGWAVDDSAVRNVRIYVDGEYKASATLTVPRPDVTRAFPKYTVRGANYGWGTLVDLGEVAGSHTIGVQVVDDRGATRGLGPVTVNLIGR